MIGTAGWDDSLPEQAMAAIRGSSPRVVEAALRRASAFVHTLPFKGQPARVAQRLAWPRRGVVDAQGEPVLGVPAEVQDAINLVAGFIVAKIAFEAPATSWVALILGHLVEDGTDLGACSYGWR